MADTDGRNLRGDALTAHAAALGIAREDFQDADGSIREAELRRRVSEVERYATEFHFGKILVVCLAAFAACAFATWMAMYFLAPQ